MRTIRIATAADASELSALAARTFPLACPPGTLASSIAAHVAANLSRERFEGHLGDPGATILVADDHGLAGYTMLVRGEPGDPDVVAAVTSRPTIELSKVYVDAAQHGSGLAHELMERTLAVAAEDEADSVWLGVNQGNSRAIRFYEKSGFRIAGTKLYWVGPEVMRDHVMLALL